MLYDLIGVTAVVVIIILRGDKVSGSVLAGVSFRGASDGNIEGVGPGEANPLDVSCGTEIGTIQGTDGEVFGIILGAAYRSKPGGEEITVTVLSCGSSEVTWIGNFEGEGHA